MRTSLIVSCLLIAGCVGDVEPEPPPAAPLRAQPLTPSEIALYRRDLDRMLTRPYAEPRVARRGAISAPTQGYLNISLARVGEDGSMHQACVEDTEQAIHFLTGAPTGVTGQRAEAGR